MKKPIAVTTLVGYLCLGSVVAVADSQEMGAKLAEEKQCTTCHASDADVPRSPSFSSISQRYTMDDFDRLVVVVLTGGEDHWGSANMPDMDARAEVSRKEAETLVEWILGMKDEEM